MKLSKAAIKNLPKARHSAFEKDVVHFKAVKNSFGEEIVWLYYEKSSEVSNMSMRRFKEMYIVL